MLCLPLYIRRLISPFPIIDLHDGAWRLSKSAVITFFRWQVYGIKFKHRFFHPTYIPPFFPFPKKVKFKKKQQGLVD
jgi:hypothetical protein